MYSSHVTILAFHVRRAPTCPNTSVKTKLHVQYNQKTFRSSQSLGWFRLWYMVPSYIYDGMQLLGHHR